MRQSCGGKGVPALCEEIEMEGGRVKSKWDWYFAILIGLKKNITQTSPPTSHKDIKELHTKQIKEITSR